MESTHYSYSEVFSQPHVTIVRFWLVIRDNRIQIEANQNSLAMILRRLGLSPAQRSTECVACNNCPDLFELEDGDFAVIGHDVTDELIRHLPGDAGCGANERIVRIPKEVLLAARSDIPAL